MAVADASYTASTSENEVGGGRAASVGLDPSIDDGGALSPTVVVAAVGVGLVLAVVRLVPVAAVVLVPTELHAAAMIATVIAAARRRFMLTNRRRTPNGGDASRMRGGRESSNTQADGSRVCNCRLRC